MFGAAEALYERAGIALPPFNRIKHPKTVAAIRAAQGEAGFGAAHAAGCALQLEQVLTEAITLATEVKAIIFELSSGAVECNLQFPGTIKPNCGVPVNVVSDAVKAAAASAYFGHSAGV